MDLRYYHVLTYRWSVGVAASASNVSKAYICKTHSEHLIFPSLEGYGSPPTWMLRTSFRFPLATYPPAITCTISESLTTLFEGLKTLETYMFIAIEMFKVYTSTQLHINTFMVSHSDVWLSSSPTLSRKLIIHCHPDLV